MASIMSKKVAFVLSGCGYMDGAEIQEAVSALIALDRAGYEIIFTAPDVNQNSTVDHISGNSIEDVRSVLKESARIARGNIRPLSSVTDDYFDLIVFPGGFGAATTLCTFAKEGAGCSVIPLIRGLIERAHSAGKPIAAMCIAPVLLARCIPGVEITIGNDRGTAKAVEAMGAHHVDCSPDDAVTDNLNRVVTTPAYMLAEGPARVYAGAVRMVEELDLLLGF